ncbi:MAG: tetratricopeptide repeat protein, partial [Caldilineae bacterium]
IVGGAGAITFLVLLRDPQGPLQSLRNVPALSRLSGALDTSRGTGKVRVLIWEAAQKLVAPHEPLGIPGDYTDGVNAIRPLVGYGPESMFNAFAFVYPPELAHVEQRGSSADRSHNETMDSLVMTGVVGFLAFYFLMGSLFYYAIKWLGWVPDRKAGIRLMIFMALAGVAGVLLPYVLQGTFTLSVLGLPFGLFGGFFLYLCVQAFLPQSPEARPVIPVNYVLLLIGMLGAFIGHFLEVHFVFSIAATYTYFWAYLGLMVALARIGRAEAKEATAAAETPAAEAPEPAEEPLPAASRRRRRRRKSRAVKRPRLAVALSLDAPETWETWLGSLGLAMAIILIILTFDFVPIQFDLSTGRYSLLWMTSITFLVGTAVALSDVAVKADSWQTPVNWGRAVLLYFVTSLGYAGFYILLHSQQRHILTTRQLDVLSAANGIVGILYSFYIALVLLMVVIALMLLQRRTRGLPFWRPANWWLYPPLIAAAVLVIFFKNLNVVKADIYLKEGERYRNAQQWDNAILLHHESVRMDSDEDFYYLMLALDYQLKAQDNRLPAQERQQAWLEGERIALQARDINKYNPDNTGNLGRYYFTLGQLLNPSYYDKALDYFRKAIYLAPQNVQYYNLLAQVYYIKNQFDDAITWLEKSIELDAEFPPTWLQLGDTYAATSDVDKALEAHKRGILQDPAAFADPNFDSRLNFYISANRHEELIQAFRQFLDEHPPKNKRERNRQNKILWAIGHAYLRAGQTEEGVRYLQQAVDQGYKNAVALQELANAYLTQNQLARAETLYKQALQQKNANQPQIYSSLGYIYAQTGRLQEAIDANNKVLESLPNDYDSHKNLALLYQQAGQIDQAIQHAEAALQVAPEARKADLQTFIEQLRAQQSP